MQIPQEYPQFTDEPTLLVITGAEAGQCYLALNGLLTEVLNYEEPTPSFSDTEGFFETRSHGQVLRAGAVREPRDQEDHERFARTFAQKVAAIEHEVPPTAVFLAAPDYMVTLLKQELPDSVVALLTREERANLTHEHPLSVLGRFTSPQA
ncbi:hypothetical protein GVX82_00340 [Patescibacteria group bacterium]|jgi:hypothetical protein|nr:hypothetical protein [Patescibacteria group bacterium]